MTLDPAPLRQLIAAEETRLLTRRLRLGLLAAIAVIVAFGAADVSWRRETIGALLLVKVAQLLIAVAGVLLTGGRAPRLAVRTTAVLVVSAIYATIAAAGILRGDAPTAAILLLAGVMASATVLPWGARAQLATVAAAATALLATASSVPEGSAAIAGHRGLAFALAFAGSVVVAAAQARHRRERERVAAVLAEQGHILERITAGAPLPEVLDTLTRTIERLTDGMFCSVLLLDGDRLRHGAGGSLPDAYCAAVDGLVIGPAVGSCGTAAYLRRTIIVTDIATDSLWRDFRELALAHGLRACWSAPIVASDGGCLGTLAMYYPEPRRPSRDDLALIELAAHLAGVAIERRRGEDALLASRRQLEDESHVSGALVHAGQVMISSVNTPVILERLSQITTKLLGCDCSDTVVRRPSDDVYVTESAHGYSGSEWETLRHARLPPAALTGLLAALAEQPLVQVRTASVSDAGAARLLEEFGITVSMYAALRRGNELIGFLSAAYRGGASLFTARQQRIATGIAQLASMALENARLVEEAKRASQLKTEFVSTMSHELRTPLSVIIGYTDMLGEDVGRAEQGNILAKIRGSSLELLEMIEMTLNVSRLEAGKDLPHFERLSLPALLAELASEFAALPRNARTILRWEPAAALAISSDRRKLRIILKNLIGNALKFTPAGEVVVRCDESDGRCAISVHDTGIGIAREQLPVIFDMFRQGDSSDARSYGGVGLGLYIVRRLVQQLGGDVAVESTVGRGTCFTVRLPLADDALRASA